jgi:hypothetical protein
MSTLSTTNLKNASAGGNNIVLNSDGSIGGTALASTSDVNGVNTTGTVTASTTSLVVASATGIAAGMFVVGEGIAPGTTVSSIASTTVTLSANANTTLSADPVTFYSASKILTPAVVGSQLCRAWVNFDGTGTVAIRASFNVSSITDNGTGDYTVNFTTALADANYSPSIVARLNDAAYWEANILLFKTAANANSAPTTSGFRFGTYKRGFGGMNDGVDDVGFACIAVFR